MCLDIAFNNSFAFVYTVFFFVFFFSCLLYSMFWYFFFLLLVLYVLLSSVVLGPVQAHWKPAEESPTRDRHWARTASRDTTDAWKDAGNWCQASGAAQGKHVFFITNLAARLRHFGKFQSTEHHWFYQRKIVYISNFNVCTLVLAPSRVWGFRGPWGAGGTWSACVRGGMTVCSLDGVGPLGGGSWGASVRRCQVLPTRSPRQPQHHKYQNRIWWWWRSQNVTPKTTEQRI